MAGSSKRVGVIGGMGPEATVDFLACVIRMTPADVDQDHVRMIIEHDPQTPSRQLAMHGVGESPGPAMAAMASRLERAGADFLVMPCNLAHAWLNDIVAAIRIPFVSIVEETINAALDRGGDKGVVGLMTTPGCFEAGLYQQALTNAGCPMVLQTSDELAETMALVEKIKRGEKTADVEERLRSLANDLIARGATILIAACTEFPLLLKQEMFDVAFISSTESLAKKTVAIALGAT